MQWFTNDAHIARSKWWWCLGRETVSAPLWFLKCTAWPKIHIVSNLTKYVHTSFLKSTILICNDSLHFKHKVVYIYILVTMLCFICCCFMFTKIFYIYNCAQFQTIIISRYTKIEKSNNKNIYIYIYIYITQNSYTTPLSSILPFYLMFY